MANFDFDFPEDMLSGLDSILDNVAPKMIEEALPVYEKAVKNKLEKHRDTGELIASIHCKQSKTKTGAYIGYLTADGSSGKTTYKRKNGKSEPFRNFQKAMGLEYGTKDGREPARPFMQAAVNASEEQVLDKMQQVFNREVKS